jgi:Ca2+-binding RTX toxin-like protein
MVDISYTYKSDLPSQILGNLDPAVQSAIISQLIAPDGLYNLNDDNKAIWVESDYGLKTDLFGRADLDPTVSLLEVEGKTVVVDTDAALKVIVDDGNGTHNLTVNGDFNEFIVLGNSNTKVTLTGLGNDTVLGGGGHDTILANGGNDSLVAGTGNTLLQGEFGFDTLVGGSGNDTLLGGGGANHLIGGSGNSTLTAGSGHGSLLQAGTGNTLITDMSSGGHDTLVAASGQDTIVGQQGDSFNVISSASMPASGHDLYKIYDGDNVHNNSVINLGTGGDTVKFFTTAGSDTINSGGGTDTIDFTNSSHAAYPSAAAITQGTSGDWTINFTDGQSVVLNAHDESKHSDAFVLKFDGHTVHLPGGS